MQEKNSQSSKSLGVCQKLFNFFMGNLFAHGVKRITSEQHDSSSPAKPNGETMMVRVQDHENSKDDLGSEIEVQFKQFEDEQSQMMQEADRIPDQVRSSRDKATGKGKKVGEQPPPGGKKEVPLIQEKTIQPQLRGKTSPNLTTPARPRVPKKNYMVSVIDGEELAERSTRKGKNIPSDQILTLEIQKEEVKKTPRRLRPPPSEALNINDYSEKFIKTKKEEMHRKLNMDTKSSKST